MKKQEMLKMIDRELLESLYGYSYARTTDSYEAEELCSDIVYALVKAANAEGDVSEPYAFLWRIARNVYADFCQHRSQAAQRQYIGDPEPVLSLLAESQEKELDRDSTALVQAIYKQLAFLSSTYRSVMISFYLDGLSTAQIAKKLQISEVAVRQRLFSARQKIKNEVNKMNDNKTKPVALDRIEYTIWGTGRPNWGDPRDGFVRQFSKHIVYLCSKKPRTATEIALELNVPTVYVEDELEVLVHGSNGKYGFLRKTENGKYALNFVLFDTETMDAANAIYTEHLPWFADLAADFIQRHREEYLAFPYLNRKKDLNLILWQQVTRLADTLQNKVHDLLKKKYFQEYPKVDRPFSVFGFECNGTPRGGAGWDGTYAENVCGFSWCHFDNIYIKRIKKHFDCGENVAGDTLLQLALMSIDGLSYEKLSEKSKEHAAKAIEQGYIYREGDLLYTKILVCEGKDRERLYKITKQFAEELPENILESIADPLGELIQKNIPEHLYGEWEFANTLASLPILDLLVEELIQKGLLIPPENGIGAEGCWVTVSK